MNGLHEHSTALHFNKFGTFRLYQNDINYYLMKDRPIFLSSILQRHSKRSHYKFRLSCRIGTLQEWKVWSLKMSMISNIEKCAWLPLFWLCFSILFPLPIILMVKQLANERYFCLIHKMPRYCLLAECYTTWIYRHPWKRPLLLFFKVTSHIMNHLLKRFDF